MSGVDDLIRLDGRVAAVTGSGRGFGKRSACELAALGASVAIVELEEDLGAQVAAQLQASGGTACAVRCDVSDPGQVAAAFASVERELGPVDILVNNAGAATFTPFLEVTEDEWDHVFAVNLTGTYLCCKATMPGMAERGFGRVVNISSIAGKRGGGFLGRTPYAASKAGILGLTRALAREFAADGVTVNAIAPGPMDTEMTKILRTDHRLRAKIEAIVPLGRRGTIQDVADAVCFLCSDLASYFTGETLNVDGGVSME
ncbi:MAG: SDR family NAD(P)-dependent oxidoreductase [Actinomycetia bacterium]|nr:SDR family NAD(P)-dependent oxidoreductase [Actinomycetes bacterium]